MTKQPAVDDLMAIIDSRYALVVVVAKRARSLISAQQDEESHINPVTEAIRELQSGDLRYYRVPQTADK
jgi:DNA-directed RNA polymerase subunit omega